MQYTLRNIPKILDEDLRRRAKEEHKSLNRVAIEALMRALGLTDDTPLPQRDLGDVSGSWKRDAQTDRALEEQRSVDAELWG